MSHYNLRYGHSSNAIPGEITRDFADDEAAVEALQKLVRDGYRNETWASVTLSDGRSYVADNQHGRAIGRYT